MDKKNLVLIGFMGCGKTTLGSIVARKLSFSFVDTDKFIEQQEKSIISEIFSKYGEKHFRDVEKKHIETLSLRENSVIATGGGVIKDYDNIMKLKEKGVVVYLKSSPRAIYKNIGRDNTRPLLKNHTNKFVAIKKLFRERTPLYEKYADITVDIADININKSVSVILQAYENYDA